MGAGGRVVGGARDGGAEAEKGKVIGGPELAWGVDLTPIKPLSGYLWFQLQPCAVQKL